MCGRLVLVDPETRQNVDGIYWQYETFLKNCEGRLGALLGANGAIYALRRSLYVPIANDTIVDDFVIPLLAKLSSGCKIIYDSEAEAREETPPNMSCEFRRRVRIGGGGFQSIGMLWRLLNPRFGWLSFSFLSHKILRWFCPFFLLGLLLTNLALCGSSFYRMALTAQATFLHCVSHWGVPAGRQPGPASHSSVDDVYEHEPGTICRLLALDSRPAARHVAPHGAIVRPFSFVALRGWPWLGRKQAYPECVEVTISRPCRARSVPAPRGCAWWLERRVVIAAWGSNFLGLGVSTDRSIRTPASSRAGANIAAAVANGRPAARMPLAKDSTTAIDTRAAAPHAQSDRASASRRSRRS